MRNPLHRLRFTIVAVFLLTGAGLPARAWAETPTTAPATGKCMMWKVSSDSATLYLVGSMHLATPEMYPLPKEMDDAFAKADTLVVEVNTNKLDQQKLMSLVQSKGMYQGDETLSANLPKDTLQSLQEECAKVGLPIAGIDKMKPWVVELTLEVLEIQKLGLDPNLGIDKHFLDLAAEKGKTIEELESADFQINLLAGFNSKMQEKSLVATLAEMKDLKSDLTALSDAWIAGDGNAVWAQCDREMKAHPETAEVQQKLIFDRNGPMAEKVKGYLKGSKTVFIVAGCLHMVGDHGIVQILRDDKFTVEQSPATRIAKADK